MLQYGRGPDTAVWLIKGRTQVSQIRSSESEQSEGGTDRERKVKPNMGKQETELKSLASKSTYSL